MTSRVIATLPGIEHASRMTTDNASLLYAGDLTAGREFPFSTFTLSEAEILDYAGRWDPLPIHADPAAARDGPHGGIIASGLQTLAIYQRLVVAALWSRVVGIGGRGFEVRFRRPVRPGTTLSGCARIDRVTARPERGDAVVHVVSQLTDEEGRVVMEVVADAVILERPADAIGA